MMTSDTVTYGNDTTFQVFNTCISTAGTSNQPVLQTLPEARFFPRFTARQRIPSPGGGSQPLNIGFNLAMEYMMGMVQECQRHAHKKKKRSHKSSNHPIDQWTKQRHETTTNHVSDNGSLGALRSDEVWLQILEFGGKQPKKSGVTTPKWLLYHVYTLYTFMFGWLWLNPSIWCRGLSRLTYLQGFWSLILLVVHPPMVP